MNRTRRAAIGVIGALALVCNAAARPAAAAHPAVVPLQGTVTEVYDGQTLQVTQTDGSAIEVRLAGIDAPLSCQPWGPESRAALKDWVQGRLVTVLPVGAPVKGRVVGTVKLEDAVINSRMAEEGHAWSQRVKWDRGPYVKQERLAHSLGRGLFSKGGAVRPADFKRNNRPCA
jgi:endonuclease YncB( thermonuclease family)